jgi:ABC-type nitrate/sulfonate/bicarbonate transport system substrate-binding protein
MNAEALRLIAFPGAPNLPIFAALERGLFENHGVNLTLGLTTSSIAQATNIAAGEFDIALTAFDNVVAYSTGQGAAGEGVEPDYVVIMGATQLELSLVAEPSVQEHLDLRGKSIALDALETGFAFVLYEMLDRAGIDRAECEFVAVGATPQRWSALQSGGHSATLTIEPFTSLATAEGYRVIDSSARLFDEYQGGVVAARRSALEQKSSVVGGFIAGYLDGLAWVLDPANRGEVTDLLVQHMDTGDRATGPAITSVLSPQSGLTPEARILPHGMRTVLDLRARHGRGVVLDEVDSFCDLRLWTAAVESREPS